MLEVTPEPNLIIPFDPTHTESVRDAFHVFGVACETLAQHALALLAQLFRYAEINYHGGFDNLATGATSILRIDPRYWKCTRRASQLKIGGK